MIVTDPSDWGAVGVTAMIVGMAHPGASALNTSHPAPGAEADTRPPARRPVRFAAVADDLGRLLVGSIATFLVALAFLFWRTSWGAVDATASDTAIATALLLAPAPTWLAWMLAGAIEDSATPGQRRRGIGVQFASPRRRARLIRFAIHPLSAPGWLWLAAIAYLLALGPLSWLLTFVAAAVTVTGLGSTILLALGRRSLHDLVLGSSVSEVEAPA